YRFLNIVVFFFFFKQKTAYEIGLGIPAEPLFRSNVPSRSPLPALAIAPETKLGTASSGLGTLEPYSTRNKTRDGLIRVRIIRALNGRFNTSITHAYSIVIGSKHITLDRKSVV